jgi:outer membrane lipoprotein-sorting protein
MIHGKNAGVGRKPTRFPRSRRLAPIACLLTLFTVLPARAELQAWNDYQGKGEINISVQDVNMNIQMEQTFRKPGTMLLNLDVLGLKQTIWMEGSVEQTYNPAQGLVIEKRYLHLEKADVNPMVAAQASMEDFGRRIREAKSAQVVGKETVIGYECDVVQLDTKELIQQIANGGVLTSKKILDQLGPTTKAWVCRDYGLPVKVDIPGADGKPAMSFEFKELKVNTGVKDGALRLEVPRGTRRVSVTADLADPGWEAKMNADVRKATEEQLKSQKKPG